MRRIAFGGTRPDGVDAAEALRLSGAIDALAAYDPHWAGTVPIGVDVAGSDIDLLCFAPDLDGFAAVIERCFGGERGFTMQRRAAVVARFWAHGWEFEIYGAAVPVAEQAGWRHMLVERRLLDQGGEAFRAAVMARREVGMKTEPAFAEVLGLAGDPYAALLVLEDDAVLVAALAAAGYSSGV